MGLGWVAEWSIAAVLKTAVPARVPGVRIPPHPLLAIAAFCSKFTREICLAAEYRRCAWYAVSVRLSSSTLLRFSEQMHWLRATADGSTPREGDRHLRTVRGLRACWNSSRKFLNFSQNDYRGRARLSFAAMQPVQCIRRSISKPLPFSRATYLLTTEHYRVGRDFYLCDLPEGRKYDILRDLESQSHFAPRQVYRTNLFTCLESAE